VRNFNEEQIYTAALLLLNTLLRCRGKPLLSIHQRESLAQKFLRDNDLTIDDEWTFDQIFRVAISSFGISWCILFLVKKTLHCRRAGFEPLRTSSFRKRVKAHQVLGETARARTTIPHFVLLLKLLVVLASSIGGDRLFRNRFAMQTTAPSGSGTSESGW